MQSCVPLGYDTTCPDICRDRALFICDQILPETKFLYVLYFLCLIYLV